MISVDHSSNLKITLDRGIVIDYPSYLDGGGTDFSPYFVKVVRSTGKEYNNAFEWCSGFGLMGYDLLGNSLCKKISFSDNYLPAIENCMLTAKNNNLEDKVTCYLSGAIAEISNTEPWDLVIGNPPNCFEKEQLIRALVEHGNHKDVSELGDLTLTFRLTLDEGGLIQKEFFENIGSKITPDADIFLTGNGSFREGMEFAEQNGFVCVGQTPIPFGILKIFHFKLK